jgi:hypothetical protein
MSEKTDTEKVHEIRRLLSDTEWCPSDVETVRRDLVRVLGDVETEYDRVQQLPDGARVTLLGRPCNLRIHDITDGTRTAWCLLTVDGGHIHTEVGDAYVTATVAHLTGKRPCLVTGRIDAPEPDPDDEPSPRRGRREVRLCVESTADAPEGTPAEHAGNAIVSEPDLQSWEQSLLERRAKLIKRLHGVDDLLQTLTKNRDKGDA